jgi:branched-chain amino acid transport system substrate-binding protein
MRLRASTTFIVLNLATLACSEEAPPEKAKVTMGFGNPFTGGLATQGVIFEQAARLAENQVNKNGGIRGKQLELLAKDTSTNGEVAGRVAQEFVDQGVTGIVTGDGTASAMAMLGVTVPANAVLVVGTAQTVALARPENNGLFFRPGSSTANEAVPLATTVIADGHQKLAVIASMLPYTTSLYAEFEKAYTAGSCDPAPCEISYHGTYPADADPETFDFSELVAQALEGNPDALFVDSYPADAKAVLDAAWAAGYRGQLYTSQAAGNENLAPFLPDEQASRIKWVALADADGPSTEFMRALWTNSGFRAEDFFGPVYSNYDAVFVLALALAHADSSDGQAIAESMRIVANPPGEPMHAGDWAKALAALERGEDIDYVGVTGEVNFDDLGNNGEIVTVLKGYSAGEQVVLSRFE